ncbi:MAG: hypothetical protein K6A45_09380, partial [Lachnospiraceae bacterium]|nr:hypothetical protein [Lachnospiraceae bacterium]
NAGIKLIRVIPPGQKEFDNCICITLTEDTIHSYKYALRHILRIIGIIADIDIERDTEAINGTVLTEGVHDEESYDKDNTTGTWNTTLAGNMLPHKQKTRRI